MLHRGHICTLLALPVKVGCTLEAAGAEGGGGHSFKIIQIAGLSESAESSSQWLWLHTHRRMPYSFAQHPPPFDNPAVSTHSRPAFIPPDHSEPATFKSRQNKRVLSPWGISQLLILVNDRFGTSSKYLAAGLFFALNTALNHFQNRPSRDGVRFCQVGPRWTLARKSLVQPNAHRCLIGLGCVSHGASLEDCCYDYHVHGNFPG